MVFAPLIMGGNRPLPLLVLELGALALFAFALARPAFREHLPRPFLAALGLLCALPLLHLVPLPEFLWQLLPGRGFYESALGSALGASAARSISVVPGATQAAWLALLPPLAVFIAAVGVPDERLKQLVTVFIAMAAAEAVLGLAQYGTGSRVVLFLAQELRVDSALGTYPNRDHLAGLLEMALPVTLALLAANYQRAEDRHHHRYHRKGLRARLSQIFSEGLHINRMAVYGAMSLALLLGLVFTRSRTGIALGMLGILVSALLFARRLGGGRAAGIATVISVIGLALAVEVGLAPVLQRFSVEGVEADARWSIFSGAVAGIGEFFPLGSGVGTFPDVYRRFQPGDVGKWVNHAHNEYLEWLFEGGIVAALLIVAFLWFYLRGWAALRRQERWSTLGFMQAGAGIALLLMALHGLVDFNLHIPANAIYFAFLAAVFFHRTQAAPEPAAEKQPRRREEPKFAPPPVPENVPNPFAE